MRKSRKTSKRTEAVTDAILPEREAEAERAFIRWANGVGREKFKRLAKKGGPTLLMLGMAALEGWMARGDSDV